MVGVEGGGGAGERVSARLSIDSSSNRCLSKGGWRRGICLASSKRRVWAGGGAKFSRVSYTNQPSAVKGPAHALRQRLNHGKNCSKSQNVVPSYAELK